MGLAAIAGEAVCLGIAAVARPLRAHATNATRVQATSVSAVAVNEWAQVVDAVGAVRVANLPSGRLAALCDHPGRVPSKLSVHPDEGGVHAVAEQHDIGGSHRSTLHRQRQTGLETKRIGERQ